MSNILQMTLNINVRNGLPFITNKRFNVHNVCLCIHLFCLKIIAYIRFCVAYVSMDVCLLYWFNRVEQPTQMENQKVENKSGQVQATK